MSHLFLHSSPISSDVVTSAQWFLNNTLLEDSDIDNVQTLAGTIQLRFTPVSLDYNMTRIRCRGTLTSGRITTSGEVLLCIQGLVKAIEISDAQGIRKWCTIMHHLHKVYVSGALLCTTYVYLVLRVLE